MSTNKIREIREIQLSYKRTGLDYGKVTSSQKAVEVFRNWFTDEMVDFYEEFYIMILDRANNVLGVKKISSGGLDACLVDVRIVFCTALLAKGSAIILAHNHPTGALKASQPDLKITERLKKGGQILDISILDHVIITSDSYMSFADEGLL